VKNKNEKGIFCLNILVFKKESHIFGSKNFEIFSPHLNSNFHLVDS
jgi:hypothetical protein